jgi:flagellar hook assembly protein FlgD
VRIGFTLANAADVTLEIYDLQGRLIETLIPGQRVMPGQHTLGWDSSALPAGMYQAALRVKGKLQTQKIVVP